MYAYHPNYVDAVVNRMRPSDSHVYLHDANFNVTALLEPDSTVVERYSYTPYGEETYLDASFAALSTQKSAFDNEILYTGRWVDPVTGLQLNRNRWYHQQLGRSLNRDPGGKVAGPILGSGSASIAARYRYTHGFARPAAVYGRGLLC